MSISIIVAMSKNRVIGVNNQLPWHLSADLKRFKAITMGKPIIMGRKTHESIGKALPGRMNIILSSDKNYSADDCVVFDKLDAAINFAEQQQDEVMIIGGANLYQQVLERANKIYLTIIDEEFDGDAFFPELNPELWQRTTHEAHQADDKNAHPYSFNVLEKQ